MKKQKPCKRVRADGIRGVLGIISPSKAVRECLFCESKCKWGAEFVMEMTESESYKVPAEPREDA